ncbi:uncharacterized protein KQ657_001292 [Scheffersomyces spartinae]|uniref:PQ loop repeat protein n=1 Tax=Scheffersomyces spartinae TaxID=45513 RepID=A0A9P8AH03_9ASCO|nr:uncharacterized protein KQ657_001292 [Scheffersomyces spartinae]KAG7192835.1 hypothetical protein KQ657_001292 [Scheffersomyces spartinae]
MGNDIAENVLGTAGTICWCIQLIPQVIRNYMVKQCEGLPPMMMFLWAASGIPFSIYFIGTDGSIPLRIQPQLFTFFCLCTWCQCLYYPPVQWPIKKVIVYVSAFVLIGGGLEVGLILWLRPLYRDGKEWPMLIVGIIASILLGIGLIPPYFELWKRKGRVVGINFVFLSTDSLGAILSMLSIVVGTMDVMSVILYAIVIFLEVGIFASQIIWYVTGGRTIIRQEKAQEKAAKRALEEQEQDEQDDEQEDDVEKTQQVSVQTTGIN